MTFCFLDVRLPCQVYWNLMEKKCCIMRLQKGGFAAGVGICWFDNTQCICTCLSESFCVRLSFCVFSMLQVCDGRVPMSIHSRSFTFLWVTTRSTFEIFFINLLIPTCFFPVILQIFFFEWLEKPRPVLLGFPFPQFFLLLKLANHR